MSPVHIDPIPGSHWRMRTGDVEVLHIANRHMTRSDFPPLVVYRTAAGHVEARSVARFKASASGPITCEARRQNDEMHCTLCRKRWDVTDPQPCGHPL